MLLSCEFTCDKESAAVCWSDESWLEESVIRAMEETLFSSTLLNLLNIVKVMLHLNKQFNHTVLFQAFSHNLPLKSEPGEESSAPQGNL